MQLELLGLVKLIRQISYKRLLHESYRPLRAGILACSMHLTSLGRRLAIQPPADNEIILCVPEPTDPDVAFDVIQDVLGLEVVVANALLLVVRACLYCLVSEF